MSDTSSQNALESSKRPLESEYRQSRRVRKRLVTPPLAASSASESGRKSETDADSDFNLSRGIERHENDPKHSNLDHDQESDSTLMDVIDQENLFDWVETVASVFSTTDFSSYHTAVAEINNSKPFVCGKNASFTAFQRFFTSSSLDERNDSITNMVDDDCLPQFMRTVTLTRDGYLRNIVRNQTYFAFARACEIKGMGNQGVVCKCVKDVAQKMFAEQCQCHENKVRSHTQRKVCDNCFVYFTSFFGLTTVKKSNHIHR